MEFNGVKSGAYFYDKSSPPFTNLGSGGPIMPLYLMLI